MDSLLSCFFPTTVVGVDDDVNFLHSLEDMLKDCFITFKGFTDPMAALRYVNDDCNSELNFSNLIRMPLCYTYNSSVVFDFSKLYNEIFNSNRFSMISTVMIDYAMPGLGGIDFAKRIKNSSIRRTLLTGVGNEKVAISSFNNEYIHRFIKKDSVILADEVRKAVRQSTNGYFSDYTKNLIRFLPESDKSALRDPVFANFFHNECLDRSYVEYYLLNTSGSYLFLTADGHTSLLSVMTEFDIENLLNIGINSGEISDEVLISLQSGNYILSWHDAIDETLSISRWGNYLRPARRLDGYQKYYFAFEENPKFNIDFSQIRSFARYKSTDIGKHQILIA